MLCYRAKKLYVVTYIYDLCRQNIHQHISFIRCFFFTKELTLNHFVRFAVVIVVLPPCLALTPTLQDFLKISLRSPSELAILQRHQKHYIFKTKSGNACQSVCVNVTLILIVDMVHSATSSQNSYQNEEKVTLVRRTGHKLVMKML